MSESAINISLRLAFFDLSYLVPLLLRSKRSALIHVKCLVTLVLHRGLILLLQNMKLRSMYKLKSTMLKFLINSNTRCTPFFYGMSYDARLLTAIMSHITNVMADGINSKIAFIRKTAFCYRNREHLKTAIYFRCYNLQLYPRAHTKIR